MDAARVSLLALTTCALIACNREDRPFQTTAPAGTSATTSRMSELEAGARTRPVTLEGPWDGNAWATSEGKLLYSYFNCVGCHAWGGGGIGPPLMDGEWIYGSEPENIYRTIVEGRPNGMPSFGGRIPPDRVWMLVAYVRSMSGLTPKDVRPGRNDNMHVKSPELATQPVGPRPSSRPSGVPPQ
jgi:cytochrome c oxidase cbb3-type subunit 3